jgi:hypothetical protein
VNCEDLGKLEAGIPLDDFIEEIQNRIPDMEFRVTHFYLLQNVMQDCLDY